MRNADHRRRHTAARPWRGFTLVELLVVIVIVLLVSAVTLPTVIPAVQNRQVSEAARVLQAALAGARDAAIRANAPRGVRLIPDGTLTGPASAGSVLTSSRIIPIEPAPDLADGKLTFPPITRAGGTATLVSSVTWSRGTAPPYPFPFKNRGGVFPPYWPPAPLVAPSATYPTPPSVRVLMVVESLFRNNDSVIGVPNTPANWFWNVRIGDRLRINDSGSYYTVIGPMTTENPENFVNDYDPSGAYGAASADPNDSTFTITYASGTVIKPQYLFLVNGVDDDGDGYVDNGANGYNENLNYNAAGQPLNDEIVPVSGRPPEWTEQEKWLGTQETMAFPAAQVDQTVVPSVTTYPMPAEASYTIVRRPVPTPGAREVSLPSATVIDMTTWDYPVPERSRLPVNPLNRAVDIMINPNGQVQPVQEFSSPASVGMGSAFYHFWIADRSDIYEPIDPTSPVTGWVPRLPMPEGTAGYPVSVAPYNTSPPRYLKRDRQLVTLFTRTGQIVANTVENFSVTYPNAPYTEAQLGIREAK